MSKSKAKLGPIRLVSTAYTFDFRNIQYVQTSTTHVLMLLYDLTDRSSFETLGPVLAHFKARGYSKWLPIILIGSKSDLDKDRRVTKEEALQLSKDYNTLLYEISSLTGDNLEICFESAIRESRKRSKKRKKFKKKQNKNVKVRALCFIWGLLILACVPWIIMFAIS